MSAQLRTNDKATDNGCGAPNEPEKTLGQVAFEARDCALLWSMITDSAREQWEKAAQAAIDEHDRRQGRLTEETKQLAQQGREYPRPRSAKTKGTK